MHRTNLKSGTTSFFTNPDYRTGCRNGSRDGAGRGLSPYPTPTTYWACIWKGLT